MGMLATITLSQGALAVATNLRVVSMSIAGYEYVSSCVLLPLIATHLASYLLTLPSEYRLYKSSDRRR